MRRRHYVVGAVVLGLLIVACFAVYAIASRITRAKNEAAEFAEEFLSAVAASWDVDEVYRRASPGFISRYPRPEVEANAAEFAELLGRFRSLKVLHWETERRAFAKDGFSVRATAKLGLLVEFERSKNRVYFELLRADDRWVADVFIVDPQPVED